MKHNIQIRERNGKFQANIGYKYDNSPTWKYKSKQGFRKQSDAKRWASQTVVELADDEGRYVICQDMTLGNAIELFLSTKAQLQANSYITYKNAMAQLDPYADVKLLDLDPVLTQQIAGSISPGFTKYIRMFWGYMIKMNLIKQSYLQIKVPEKKKKYKVISSADYQRILSSSASNEIKVFCQIAHRFGMRTGEILGLTPEYVSKNRIIVCQQWGRISGDDVNLYALKKLKNGDKGYRELPADPDILKLLNSLSFNFAEGRYFTLNKSDGINKQLKALGIAHTAHDFRHTRASEMVHAGFNLRYIAYFLGDTLDTVIKTYVDLSDEMKKQEEIKFLSYFCRQR